MDAAITSSGSREAVKATWRSPSFVCSWGCHTIETGSSAAASATIADRGSRLTSMHAASMRLHKRVLTLRLVFIITVSFSLGICQ